MTKDQSNAASGARKRKRGNASLIISVVDGSVVLNRRRHRLWLVSLLFAAILSYRGDAAKAPAIVTNSNDESNISSNRINSPNRARPKKTTDNGNGVGSTTSPPPPATSSSTTNNGSVNSLPTKPKPTALYPTPTPQDQVQQSKSIDENSRITPAAESAKSQDANSKQVELNFYHWCTQVLGIETILEIETFEYYDYMKVMPKEDWNDDEDDDDADCVEDLPMIPVRGLAASRDIAAGEVVIRIPLGALLSVATTIDKDPVLTQVMGPNARQANGWSADATDETSVLLEMPLLAVALLYHASLGQQSTLYPYIQILQATQGIETMPFLWSPSRLRAEASEGVRMVARGIQRDMNDMYDTVVPVLVEQYPHIFGRKSSDDDGDDDKDDEWMYSREKFSWAFAMITTRHWQLPIQDLHASSRRPAGNHFEESGEDAGLPPASTPTDSWVEEHGVDAEMPMTPNRASAEGVLVNHSFLAPFADLLNFGPPCTRGRYDSETHSFEITALCDFKKGQEVTFYYSDECDHVVVGAYGFMHPIVPPCPSAEEYRHRSEEWQRRAEKLEERLTVVYNALEEAEIDLDRLYEYLRECDCCRREYLESTGRTVRNRTDDDDYVDNRRHEHVRGAAHSEKDREARHGSRSKRRWMREQERSGSEF